MSTSLLIDERVVREAARRLSERKLAESHPAYLLDHVRCVDNTTGETFNFELTDPQAPWYWQREVLDDWINNPKSIALKARQIGITWLAAGYALWTMLYVPGTKVLILSINEAEAGKVVNRVWDMYKSLPEHLTNGVKVIKPKINRPTRVIEFQHPDGRISSVIGLPSTPKAGHGETAALVIFDEFSRQEYAAETWKACLPTTQKLGGRAIVISTGNGRGSNAFYQLWVNADEAGIVKRFLPWSLHPDRDEFWYQEHAMALTDPADRGEQYPRDATEAFILTGRPYFDPDALAYYESLVPEPIFRFDFDVSGPRRLFDFSDQGMIRVYAEVEEGHKYAIGADVATGRGADYSAAYVVDLTDMTLAAEFHGKIDADLYAAQLHHLGIHYNNALLAVETGGGYGEAVLIPLRDGRAGRGAYPRLYKHILYNRPDLPIAKVYGFPMNTKTRPLSLSQLKQALREKSLPFLTRRLLDECGTFIHAETNPSPRAQAGCNDDTVMACAVALEMFRIRGAHPEMDKRRKKQRRNWELRQPETQYPWQPEDTSKRDRWIDERYAKEGA